MNKLTLNKLYEYRSREISIEINNARIKDAINYYKEYQKSLIRRTCPICMSKIHENLYQYSGTFSVVKCVRCGMIYSLEVLPPNALADFYENSSSTLLLNNFYKNRNKKSGGVGSARVTEAVTLLKRISTSGSIRVLEIGCGDGSFLIALKERMALEGFRIEIYGIEGAKDQAVLAQRSGVQVNNIFIDDPSELFEMEMFDAIFMFEIIEHLVSPSIFIAACKKILKINGFLLLSTPNCLGFENLLTPSDGYRLLAHAICPPAHLNAFSTDTIRIFLFLHGFNVHKVNATGMFDSFAMIDYVNQGACLPEWSFLAEHFSSIDLEALQVLINQLNVSSTMIIAASKAE